MHGCAIDMDPHRDDIVHGVDTYSYDGSNFLSFDEVNEIWVAPSFAAIETKAKWDNVQVLKDYTKSYLKKECVTWLKKFLNQSEDGATGMYEEEMRPQQDAAVLRANVPNVLCFPAKPDVYMFSTAARVQTNTMVTCMATGFSSMNTNIQIKRDDRVLTEADGVQSSGVRPNGDGTFQRRDHVEIRKNDESKYTCEVTHARSKLHVVKEWGKKLFLFSFISTHGHTHKMLSHIMEGHFLIETFKILTVKVLNNSHENTSEK